MSHVDIWDCQNSVTMGGGYLKFYSGEFGILFGYGQRWNATRHGFPILTQAQIRGSARIFSTIQEPQWKGQRGHWGSAGRRGMAKVV